MISMPTREWAVDRPVRQDYLTFGSPQLLEAEIDEVVATLRSGWIGTGPRAAATGPARACRGQWPAVIPDRRRNVRIRR